MSRSLLKSGEITVFLSLIFLLLIGLISILITSVKNEGTKQRAESITDIAIKSAFSEYNKKLYEEYGLLYVDTAYKGVETGGTDCFRNHVKRYADVNLSEGKTDIYKLTLSYVKISNVTYATDDNYKSFRNQIREYMIKSEGYVDYLNDEDYLDSYISNKLPFLLNSADFYDLSYDEKLTNVINVIETDMRVSYDTGFSFINLLEGAKVSVAFNNINGKAYECSRHFSLL